MGHYRVGGGGTGVAGGGCGGCGGCGTVLAVLRCCGFIDIVVVGGGVLSMRWRSPAVTYV